MTSDRQPRVERVTVIELVGGPWDGREMALSLDDDGLPVAQLPVPVPGLDFSWWLTPATEPRVTHLLYVRDVFSEDRARWIYRPVT